MLHGKTLHAVPGQFIVQAWRSVNFKKGDIDSTLILRFTPKGKHGRIDLVHVNVPKQNYSGVMQGWKNITGSLGAPMSRAADAPPGCHWKSVALIAQAEVSNVVK